MTRVIDSLFDVAADHDAIVLDQWGVLHDGHAPYPGAVAALERLRANGHRLAVLSNSGKRARPNEIRITDIGYPPGLFDLVMTGGEALWREVCAGRVRERAFFAIERASGDAASWAQSLPIRLCSDPADADAILLMGLPDDAEEADWRPVLDHALDTAKPVYCSNPDQASPRAGGRNVVSPGALAHTHHERGGLVVLVGKPHRQIFDALQAALGVQRPLMVGDSLDHDIRGADAAGWQSVFIQGGLHKGEFAGGAALAVLHRLCTAKNAPAPTYMIEGLR